MFAAAGSGKTTHIVNSLSRDKRSLVITYTIANYENLYRKILHKFEGDWPENIVLMRYYYKNSCAEIGKALHMQPFTARKRLSRAKKRLKQLLADAGITLQ